MVDIKKESKAIAKHSSIYIFGNVLNKIVSFLMIPLYTSFLVPEDYGIIQLLSLTTDLIGMVISAGIASAMYRFYFDYKENNEKNEVISTAIIGFSIIAFISLSSISFFSEILSEKILDTENYYYYFLITFASLWLNTNVQMGYTFLQIQEKSKLFLSYSLARLVLGLSLNIYFVAIKQIGVLGILLSTLISSVVFTLILVVPILYNIKPRFSISKCKAMLLYGAPLIPTSLAAFVVHSSDRFFLKHFAGLADTGIYSLGYKFGNLPNTFISAPFMQIWEVRFFKSYKEENAGVLFGRLFTYLCFALFFVGLGISVLIQDVLIVISSKAYWSAYKIVPLIIVSYIVFSFQYYFNMGIYFSKKVKFLAFINISNAVLNIVLNFLLIKKYGIWGAAFSTLICFLYKIIVTYIISNKLYKINMETFRIFKLLFVSGFIYMICTQVKIDNLVFDMAVKTILVLFFPIVLFLFKFYTEEEVELIKEFIKSPRERVFSLLK